MTKTFRNALITISSLFIPFILGFFISLVFPNLSSNVKIATSIAVFSVGIFIAFLAIFLSLQFEKQTNKTFHLSKIFFSILVTFVFATLIGYILTSLGLGWTVILVIGAVTVFIVRLFKMNSISQTTYWNIFTSSVVILLFVYLIIVAFNSKG